MKKLLISYLKVKVENKEIIHDISLSVGGGEIHAIMGPNGSGKSTLAYALMGHPRYEVDARSKILLGKKNILGLDASERAKEGIFLAFQSPLTVSGVSVASLLRVAYQAVHKQKIDSPFKGRLFQNVQKKKEKTKLKNMSMMEFQKLLEAKANLLGIEKSFLRRSLNEGFSGGEKKKMEMLQALVLQPQYIIFDEIDTGLDVDALKVVAAGISALKEQGSGVIIITHYQRLLHYVRPDAVHILSQGRLVKSGGPELAQRIEQQGYVGI